MEIENYNQISILIYQINCVPDFTELQNL